MPFMIATSFDSRASARPATEGAQSGAQSAGGRHHSEVLPSGALTMSQYEYRPSILEQSPRALHSAREHGLPKDGNTDFRESVYTLWNAFGVKHPSGWRT